jgi:hypothetical protein
MPWRAARGGCNNPDVNLLINDELWPECVGRPSRRTCAPNVVIGMTPGPTDGFSLANAVAADEVVETITIGDFIKTGRPANCCFAPTSPERRCGYCYRRLRYASPLQFGPNRGIGYTSAGYADFSGNPGVNVIDPDQRGSTAPAVIENPTVGAAYVVLVYSYDYGNFNGLPGNRGRRTPR